jgi:hypothetical protein
VFGHDRAAIDETVWTVKLLSHLAAVSLQCGAMMYGTARAQNRETPICKKTCYGVCKFSGKKREEDISVISEARVCVAYVTRLYDKIKVAQYVSIIEQDDKARVKLL